jgi:hypothetical protein
MKVKITKKEVQKYLGIKSSSFKTYVSPILNLANKYAQGTRPPIVGQMSELIQKFKGRTLEDWEKWYLSQKPYAIDNATNLIMNKIIEFKKVMTQIDRETVEAWVRDLVIVKTFWGLGFQEAILKKSADILKTSYRLSTPEEESKGIDGFLGKIPISIKPSTYKLKDALSEKINIKIIYYEKVSDGIEINLREII